MAKRETFFNIIQSSKYLDELDLKSKEKEEKTFETGNFRWTFIKEYHGLKMKGDECDDEDLGGQC